MSNNDFVQYLNTLHNYNAQNSNVFGEKNINSKYYSQVMVDIPICDFIIKKLNEENPHIVVLTGHAGDGKTSLMYQIFSNMDVDYNAEEKESIISFGNGKKCLCIKDFSEFSDDDKKIKMHEISQWQKNGNYVLLVANTGPLINYFPFAVQHIEKIEAQTKLIEILDENTGEIENYFGLDVCMINVVAINNAFFAGNFLEKIIDDSKWNSCSHCEKKQYCHILRNVNQIKNNLTKTKEFITNHYIYLSEYGERLTIRSMTQQLSYMLTGGLNCNQVIDVPAYILCTPNLFFGYRGLEIDYKSLHINSVREANRVNYDKKRLRADEELYVSDGVKVLFDADVNEMINQAKSDCYGLSELSNMIKRIYFFYNIQTDKEKNQLDLEDIFSPKFERYINIKFNGEVPNSKDHGLFKDAFSMLNTGAISSQMSEIPITLTRDSGYIQNVQYIIGTIKKSRIKLVQVESNHSAYLGSNGYSDLYLKIDKTTLNKKINLPLMDYFYDLRSGIVSTNIDAQLSKGLESINSEILSVVKSQMEENQFSLLLTNNNIDVITLTLEDGKIVDN